VIAPQPSPLTQTGADGVVNARYLFRVGQIVTVAFAMLVAGVAALTGSLAKRRGGCQTRWFDGDWLASANANLVSGRSNGHHVGSQQLLELRQHIDPDVKSFV